jgi:hypothetical protein
MSKSTTSKTTGNGFTNSSSNEAMLRPSWYSGTATKRNKPFTSGSLEYIKANAGKMSAKAIAAVLHRSVYSVSSKIKAMGLA